MRTWNKKDIIRFLDHCPIARDIVSLRMVSAQDKDKFYWNACDIGYDGIPIIDDDSETISKLFDTSLRCSISSIRLHSMCDGLTEGDEILVKTIEKKDGSTNIDADVIEAFLRLFNRILEYRKTVPEW